MVPVRSITDGLTILDFTVLARATAATEGFLSAIEAFREGMLGDRE